MTFKNISKILCLLLAAVMVFTLSACGKKEEKAPEPEFSLYAEEVVVDPDMEEYKHAVYSIDLEGEVDSVTVYYKDDVIMGLDQNSVAEVGDRTQEDIDALLAKVNDKYAALAEKKFVEFKVFYAEESGSLVMNFHARKLDKKENLQLVADLGIFGALSSDSTYTELDEILTKMGFEKQ